VCDLFGLSCSREYAASRSLPLFAEMGRDRRDKHGWGVGFYFSDGSAHVEKCAGEAWVSQGYEMLARSVRSKVIVVHLRLASRAGICDRYCHPFKLRFRSRDWLFAHNGDCASIVNYRTKGERIEGTECLDSPRIFEYLRDHILNYLERKRKGSLFGAVRFATEKLMREHPRGTFNFLLTNGDVLFAHVDKMHSRNRILYGLRREKGIDVAFLVTTIPNLTDETWMEFRPTGNYRGKLLMISEGELLYNGDTKG